MLLKLSGVFPIMCKVPYLSGLLMYSSGNLLRFLESLEQHQVWWGSIHIYYLPVTCCYVAIAGFLYKDRNILHFGEIENSYTSKPLQESVSCLFLSSNKSVSYQTLSAHVHVADIVQCVYVSANLGCLFVVKQYNFLFISWILMETHQLSLQVFEAAMLFNKVAGSVPVKNVCILFLYNTLCQQNLLNFVVCTGHIVDIGIVTITTVHVGGL